MISEIKKTKNLINTVRWVIISFCNFCEYFQIAFFPLTFPKYLEQGFASTTYVPHLEEIINVTYLANSFSILLEIKGWKEFGGEKFFFNQIKLRRKSLVKRGERGICFAEKMGRRDAALIKREGEEGGGGGRWAGEVSID